MWQGKPSNSGLPGHKTASAEIKRQTKCPQIWLTGVEPLVAVLGLRIWMGSKKWHEPTTSGSLWIHMQCVDLCFRSNGSLTHRWEAAAGSSGINGSPQKGGTGFRTRRVNTNMASWANQQRSEPAEDRLVLPFQTSSDIRKVPQFGISRHLPSFTIFTPRHHKAKRAIGVRCRKSLYHLIISNQLLQFVSLVSYHAFPKYETYTSTSDPTNLSWESRCRKDLLTVRCNWTLVVSVLFLGHARKTCKDICNWNSPKQTMHCDEL